MNKKIVAISAISLLALFGCNKEKTKPVSEEIVLDSLEKKVSYAIGLNVAQGVNSKEFGFDTAAFTQAVEDFRADTDPRLSQDEIQAVMQTFQTTQREIMAEKRKQEGAKGLSEGKIFLEAKAQEEGVVTTESGLMYKIITAGQGEKPAATDTVKAHYKGSLIDGTEFDSSYRRGEPATFGVSNLIPGWVEALQLMPAGSKWELYIPGELAYGEQGNQAIPPNSTLIFELELLEIVKEETETEATAEK